MRIGIVEKAQTFFVTGFTTIKVTGYAKSPQSVGSCYGTACGCYLRLLLATYASTLWWDFLMIRGSFYDKEKLP